MKVVIYKKRLCMLLLILPFFEPEFISFFESMKYIELLFSASRVLVSLYVIKEYLFKRKYHKIPVKLFILYELSIIFVNVMNKTIYFTFIVSCITSIGFFILNYYLFLNNNKYYFKIYSKLMGFYLFINFLSQILYPNGIVPNRVGDNRIWFLGTKNSVTTYVLLFLLTYLTYSLLQYGKIKKKIFISFIIIISIYGKSMTAILAITMIILLYLCLRYLRVSKRDFKAIVLLALILIAIIFITDLKNVIINLVALVTGKDVTFSGRIEIWKQATEFFLQSPWIGQGIGLSFSPWTNGAVVYSAHNVYLELLSKYGVLVGGIYIFMMGKGWLNLIKNKNGINNIENEINNIGISFITVFILISGFEAYNDYIRAFVISYSSYILLLGSNKISFENIVEEK